MTAQPLTIETEPLDALRPNSAHINEHLYALFAPEFAKDHPDAWIELAYADMAGDGVPNAAEHFLPFELEKAVEFAEKKNKAGFNLYVGVALRQGETGPSGRSSGDNFLASLYAWSDSDDAGGLDRINDVLKANDLRTSMLVMTGRTPHERAHLYFRLDGSVTTEQVRSANIALKNLLGTDDVEDVCRVMRLAGTVSYPTGKKRARGYVPELVTLHIRKNMPCYTVERLTGFAGNLSSSIDSNGAAKPGRDDSTLETLLETSRSPGQWHNSIRDAIATMIGRGWSDLQIRLACAPYCTGGTNDPDLDDLINRAREKWNKPSEEPNLAAVEISRLANLPLLDYERARRDAAKALGFRASALDLLVQGERARLGFNGGDDDDAGLQGRAISFPEPEPWPETVDGVALLDEISKVIGSHVIMSEASRDACALWAALTYLLDCTMISPRLAITSPTRGCGKTTALDVISQLVLRPLPAANVSASAIFRVVEGFRPTLMIDEADSFLRDNEELRGVLNSGHRKGGAVLRNVGDDHEPRSFSTYSACAIALIGQLPGTLTDRSVPIMLTRRKRDEAITPFRLDRVDHLVILARKLARWTTDNLVAIAATEPEIPAGIYNRAADNWRPLLAIAEVAGGDWPERGQKAALTSVAAEVDDTSWLELVLGDIRAIFISKGVDRIPSAILAKTLADMEGRPWAEYGRSEKPITPGKLARLLKPLAVVPENIRVVVQNDKGDDEEKVVKGYRMERFTEAFTRYLGLEGSSEPLQRYNADETGTFDLFQTATAQPDVADRKREKPNNDGHCSGVAFSKGDSGEARESCAYCGLPGGNEISVSGRSARLHRDCEEPYFANNDGLLDGWTVAKGEHGETRARHPVVTFFGIEPFAPCDQCGKADGVVHHVRFNRHLGRPSTNLHESCVSAWLAGHHENDASEQAIEGRETP